MAAKGAGDVRGLSALSVLARTPGAATLARPVLPGSADRAAGALATAGPVAAAAPTTSPVPAAGSGDRGAKAVELAKEHLGVPYKWGGTTPAGFDCSGLLQHTYHRLGVELPRVRS